MHTTAQGMDLKNQYIKLFRSLLLSDIWQRNTKFDERSAWVDLLLLANHREAVANFQGQNVPVQRGETARSIRTLADRWQWSNWQVRRFLDELEAAEMIERKRIKNASVIRIVNYEGFQDVGKPPENSAHLPQRKPHTLNDEIRTPSNDAQPSKNEAIDHSPECETHTLDEKIRTRSAHLPHPNNIYSSSSPSRATRGRDPEQFPNPDTWTPDKITRDLVAVACGLGFEITDEMVISYRAVLAKWREDGWFNVDYRQKFPAHCKRIFHGKSEPAGRNRSESGRKSLAERLEDSDW